MVAIAVPLALLAGCGGDGDPVSPGTYVGKASGTDAFAGIVVGESETVAFVSDGASGLGEPFGGPRHDNEVDLESRTGTKLEAELSEDEGSGTLVLDGEEHELSLERAEGPGGIYRSAGALGKSPVWSVWVVLDDGSQQSSASDGERVVEAPEVDPDDETITVKGEEGKVVKVEPDQSGGPGKEGPAAAGIFAGGLGFQGGVGQFGGFNQFGGQGGGFNFGGGLQQGGFQVGQGGLQGGFQGFQGGFGGGFQVGGFQVGGKTGGFGGGFLGP